MDPTSPTATVHGAEASSEPQLPQQEQLQARGSDKHALSVPERDESLSSPSDSSSPPQLLSSPSCAPLAADAVLLASPSLLTGCDVPVANVPPPRAPRSPRRRQDPAAQATSGEAAVEMQALRAAQPVEHQQEAATIDALVSASARSTDSSSQRSQPLIHSVHVQPASPAPFAAASASPLHLFSPSGLAAPAAHAEHAPAAEASQFAAGHHKFSSVAEEDADEAAAAAAAAMAAEEEEEQQLQWEQQQQAALEEAEALDQFEWEQEQLQLQLQEEAEAAAAAQSRCCCGYWPPSFATQQRLWGWLLQCYSALLLLCLCVALFATPVRHVFLPGSLPAAEVVDALFALAFLFFLAEFLLLLAVHEGYRRSYMQVALHFLAIVSLVPFVDFVWQPLVGSIPNGPRLADTPGFRDEGDGSVAHHHHVRYTDPSEARTNAFHIHTAPGLAIIMLFRTSFLVRVIRLLKTHICLRSLRGGQKFLGVLRLKMRVSRERDEWVERNRVAHRAARERRKVLREQLEQVNELHARTGALNLLRVQAGEELLRGAHKHAQQHQKHPQHQHHPSRDNDQQQHSRQTSTGTLPPPLLPLPSAAAATIAADTPAPSPAAPPDVSSTSDAASKVPPPAPPAISSDGSGSGKPPPLLLMGSVSSQGGSDSSSLGFGVDAHHQIQQLHHAFAASALPTPTVLLAAHSISLHGAPPSGGSTSGGGSGSMGDFAAGAVPSAAPTPALPPSAAAGPVVTPHTREEALRAVGTSLLAAAILGTSTPSPTAATAAVVPGAAVPTPQHDHDAAGSHAAFEFPAVDASLPSDMHMRYVLPQLSSDDGAAHIAPIAADSLAALDDAFPPEMNLSDLEKRVSPPASRGAAARVAAAVPLPATPASHAAISPTSAATVAAARASTPDPSSFMHFLRVHLDEDSVSASGSRAIPADSPLPRPHSASAMRSSSPHAFVANGDAAGRRTVSPPLSARERDQHRRRKSSAAAEVGPSRPSSARGHRTRSGSHASHLRSGSHASGNGAGAGAGSHIRTGSHQSHLRTGSHVRAASRPTSPVNRTSTTSSPRAPNALRTLHVSLPNPSPAASPRGGAGSTPPAPLSAARASPSAASAVTRSHGDERAGGVVATISPVQSSDDFGFGLGLGLDLDLRGNAAADLQGDDVSRSTRTWRRAWARTHNAQTGESEDEEDENDGDAVHDEDGALHDGRPHAASIDADDRASTFTDGADEFDALDPTRREHPSRRRRAKSSFLVPHEDDGVDDGEIEARDEPSPPLSSPSGSFTTHQLSDYATTLLIGLSLLLVYIYLLLLTRAAPPRDPGAAMTGEHIALLWSGMERTVWALDAALGTNDSPAAETLFSALVGSLLALELHTRTLLALGAPSIEGGDGSLRHFSLQHSSMFRPRAMPHLNWDAVLQGGRNSTLPAQGQQDFLHGSKYVARNDLLRSSPFFFSLSLPTTATDNDEELDIPSVFVLYSSSGLDDRISSEQTGRWASRVETFPAIADEQQRQNEALYPPPSTEALRVLGIDPSSPSARERSPIALLYFSQSSNIRATFLAHLAYMVFFLVIAPAVLLAYDLRVQKLLAPLARMMAFIERMIGDPLGEISFGGRSGGGAEQSRIRGGKNAPDRARGWSDASSGGSRADPHALRLGLANDAELLAQGRLDWASRTLEAGEIAAEMKRRAAGLSSEGVGGGGGGRAHTQRRDAPPSSPAGSEEGEGDGNSGAGDGRPRATLHLAPFVPTQSPLASPVPSSASGGSGDEVAESGAIADEAKTKTRASWSPAAKALKPPQTSPSSALVAQRGAGRNLTAALRKWSASRSEKKSMPLHRGSGSKHGAGATMMRPSPGHSPVLLPASAAAGARTQRQSSDSAVRRSSGSAGTKSSVRILMPGSSTPAASAPTAAATAATSSSSSALSLGAGALSPARSRANQRTSGGGGGGGFANETATLESSLLKLSKMIQVCFGEAGAGIITNNLARAGGALAHPPSSSGKSGLLHTGLDLGQSAATSARGWGGTKMFGIFGFADLRNIVDAYFVEGDTRTLALPRPTGVKGKASNLGSVRFIEQIMVFINELQAIVHGETHRFHGFVNSSIGSNTLVCWKIEVPAWERNHGHEWAKRQEAKAHAAAAAWQWQQQQQQQQQLQMQQSHAPTASNSAVGSTAPTPRLSAAPAPGFGMGAPSLVRASTMSVPTLSRRHSLSIITGVPAPHQMQQQQQHASSVAGSSTATPILGPQATPLVPGAGVTAGFGAGPFSTRASAAAANFSALHSQPHPSLPFRQRSMSISHPHMLASPGGGGASAANMWPSPSMGPQTPNKYAAHRRMSVPRLDAGGLLPSSPAQQPASHAPSAARSALASLGGSSMSAVPLSVTLRSASLGMGGSVGGGGGSGAPTTTNSAHGSRRNSLHGSSAFSPEHMALVSPASPRGGAGSLALSPTHGGSSRGLSSLPASPMRRSVTMGNSVSFASMQHHAGSNMSPRNAARAAAAQGGGDRASHVPRSPAIRGAAFAFPTSAAASSPKLSGGSLGGLDGSFATAASSAAGDPHAHAGGLPHSASMSALYPASLVRSQSSLGLGASSVGGASALGFGAALERRAQGSPRVLGLANVSVGAGGGSQGGGSGVPGVGNLAIPQSAPPAAGSYPGSSNVSASNSMQDLSALLHSAATGGGGATVVPPSVVAPAGVASGVAGAVSSASSSAAASPASLAPVAAPAARAAPVGRLRHPSSTTSHSRHLSFNFDSTNFTTARASEAEKPLPPLRPHKRHGGAATPGAGVGGRRRSITGLPLSAVSALQESQSMHASPVLGPTAYHAQRRSSLPSLSLLSAPISLPPASSSSHAASVLRSSAPVSTAAAASPSVSSNNINSVVGDTLTGLSTLRRQTSASSMMLATASATPIDASIDGAAAGGGGVASGAGGGGDHGSQSNSLASSAASTAPSSPTSSTNDLSVSGSRGVEIDRTRAMMPRGRTKSIPDITAPSAVAAADHPPLLPVLSPDASPEPSPSPERVPLSSDSSVTSNSSGGAHQIVLMTVIPPSPLAHSAPSASLTETGAAASELAMDARAMEVAGSVEGLSQTASRIRSRRASLNVDGSASNFALHPLQPPPTISVPLRSPTAPLSPTLALKIDLQELGRGADSAASTEGLGASGSGGGGGDGSGGRSGELATGSGGSQQLVAEWNALAVPAVHQQLEVPAPNAHGHAHVASSHINAVPAGRTPPMPRARTFAPMTPITPPRYQSSSSVLATPVSPGLDSRVGRGDAQQALLSRRRSVPNALDTPAQAQPPQLLPLRGSNPVFDHAALQAASMEDPSVSAADAPPVQLLASADAVASQQPPLSSDLQRVSSRSSSASASRSATLSDHEHATMLAGEEGGVHMTFGRLRPLQLPDEDSAPPTPLLQPSAAPSAEPSFAIARAPAVAEKASLAVPLTLHHTPQAPTQTPQTLHVRPVLQRPVSLGVAGGGGVNTAFSSVPSSPYIPPHMAPSASSRAHASQQHRSGHAMAQQPPSMLFPHSSASPPAMHAPGWGSPNPALSPQAGDLDHHAASGDDEDEDLSPDSSNEHELAEEPFSPHNDITRSFLRMSSTLSGVAILRRTASQALLAFARVLVKIASDASLERWRGVEALRPHLTGFGGKLVEDNQLQNRGPGLGLHIGWGIEGAIGSQAKIDTTYLSPHVNLASRLAAATKQYYVAVLFSQQFVRLLPKLVRDRCRLVDKVLLKGAAKPMAIYTFDVYLESEGTDAPPAVPVTALSGLSPAASWLGWASNAAPPSGGSAAPTPSLANITAAGGLGGGARAVISPLPSASPMLASPDLLSPSVAVDIAGCGLPQVAAIARTPDTGGISAGHTPALTPGATPSVVGSPSPAAATTAHTSTLHAPVGRQPHITWNVALSDAPSASPPAGAVGAVPASIELRPPLSRPHSLGYGGGSGGAGPSGSLLSLPPLSLHSRMSSASQQLLVPSGPPSLTPSPAPHGSAAAAAAAASVDHHVRLSLDADMQRLGAHRRSSLTGHVRSGGGGGDGHHHSDRMGHHPRRRSSVSQHHIALALAQQQQQQAEQALLASQHQAQLAAQQQQLLQQQQLQQHLLQIEQQQQLQHLQAQQALAPLLDPLQPVDPSSAAASAAATALLSPALPADAASSSASSATSSVAATPAVAHSDLTSLPPDMGLASPTFVFPPTDATELEQQQQQQPLAHQLSQHQPSATAVPEVRLSIGPPHLPPVTSDPLLQKLLFVLLSLQRHAPHPLLCLTHNHGAACYLRGEWPLARALFEQVLAWHPRDGPARVLLEFMARTDYRAPADWPGYRKLEKK